MHALLQVQQIANTNLHVHCATARRPTDPQGAARVLHAALALDPTDYWSDGDVLGNLGNVYAEGLNQPNRAAEYYKRHIAMEHIEGGSGSRFNFGAFLYNNGMGTWREALHHWEKLEGYLSGRDITGWGGVSVDVVRKEIEMLRKDIERATADGSLQKAEQQWRARVEEAARKQN